ncbi:MAG: T9SS type A sorting domain-containing protein, partial [Bacteroidia bacterium]
DFKFNIYPNPSSGNFNIIYLLPSNKEGKLEIFDITGKIVYEMRLPQWSTLQNISLPNLSGGIYAVKITSDGSSVVKKVILRE